MMSSSTFNNNTNMMVQVAMNDKTRNEQNHSTVVNYSNMMLSTSEPDCNDIDNARTLSTQSITDLINDVDMDSSSSSNSCSLLSNNVKACPLNESKDVSTISESQTLLSLLHPSTSRRISRIVSRESIPPSRKYDHIVSKANNAISSYNNQNLSSMLFNRSGSSLIEKIIRTINERCVQQQQQKDDVANKTEKVVLSPVTELQILHQWSSDSFYSVVILRRMGIEATLNAMTTFSNDVDVVDIGCQLLEKLCTSSETNILRIVENNGIQIILDILENYPQSDSIQLTALKVAHCLLLGQTNISGRSI